MDDRVEALRDIWAGMLLFVFVIGGLCDGLFTATEAAVFTILIGAIIFGHFLTITQTPQKVTAFLTGLDR